MAFDGQGIVDSQAQFGEEFSTVVVADEFEEFHRILIAFALDFGRQALEKLLYGLYAIELMLEIAWLCEVPIERRVGA